MVKLPFEIHKAEIVGKKRTIRGIWAVLFYAVAAFMAG